MDTAQLTMLIATMIGFVTILVAIFAMMWQMNSQNSRHETRISADIARLESTMNAQNKELKDDVRADITRLEATMDTQSRELKEEMRAMAVRVSNSELEQARLNGVNSILGEQTHTHEATGD